MLVIKHTDLINNEHLCEAEQITYFPVWLYSFEQTSDEYDFGFADHSQFLPNAPSVVLFKRGERGVLYQLGRFDVINENGRVVETYDLPYQPTATVLGAL